MAGRPSTEEVGVLTSEANVSFIGIILVIVVIGLLVITVFSSFNSIGPTEVGLVTKRFSLKKLGEDNPIAFHGEAGYQAELLMPGLRFKLWPIFGVKKFPWVQVPAGEIGVVIAQVGRAAADRRQERRSTSPSSRTSPTCAAFVDNGGQKGVQRPVLPPGTLLPIHPVAFLVITTGKVYGQSVSPEMVQRAKATGGVLQPESFGLAPEQLQVVVIAPNGPQDMIGIVTTLDGEPLAVRRHRQPAGRLRRTSSRWRRSPRSPTREIIELLLGSKNELHNNYPGLPGVPRQRRASIGLQHDPLLYGAYLLNPFLVRVEMVPMLVVNQGEVAVIKAYVGLPTLDTSGAEFKFGSIVRPGHRGIWQEPLRTGKYPINPRVYAAEIVPTSILTLNWADAVSQAHNLDAQPVADRGEEPRRLRVQASTCRCRSTCPTPRRRR